jgi:uncharacterized repeat protein (TIGR01451 family)
MEGRLLLSTFLVKNTNDSGPDSLRQAILNANSNAGADVINFAIPGSGVQKITPSTPLPAITDSVTIDGYTQPGASPNTLANSDNAVILVQIDGSLLGLGFNARGLNLAGGSSTIRGIDFSNCGESGTFVSSSSNVIEGNFFGVDPTGSTAAPGINGIDIRGENFSIANNNTVGGTTPDARNVISGSTNDGIQMVTSANVIQGNFIGTDASGTKAIGNLFGILCGGPNNVIGGTTAGAGNVISGNKIEGISINGGPASGNVVQGNDIGTDPTGKLPVGNGRFAMEVGSSGGVQMNNTIGGTAAGAGNVIAFNGAASSDGAGVVIDVGPLEVGESVLGNSIFSNTSNGSIPGRGLGIDNALDGVTLNTPNNPRNFPVITGVTATASSTTIKGTLNSAPNGTYRVEFFANAAVDPTGYGEGQTFIGFTNVTTDASGNGSFNVTLPAALPAGEPFITSTSTNATGDTSEFSLAFPQPSAASADLSITGSASPNPVTLGNDITYSYTIHSAGPSNATQVAFSEPLPAGVTFVSASASQGGTPTFSSGAVSAALGNLANGASATVTVVVRPTAAGTVNTTATVSGNEPDPTSQDNQKALSVTVNNPPPVSADLSITGSVAPNPVTLGGEITYSYTVHNAGPSNATQAVLSEPLPAGVTFVSASASQGGTPIFADGSVTASLGTLPDGASATVTVLVRPTAAGTVTTSATVRGNETDPTLQDNVKALSVTVNKPTPVTADLAITSTASARSVTLGNDLVFSLTVSNSGPSEATGVILTDTLPAGATLLSATSSQGGPVEQFSGGFTANLGNLAPGSSATVTIRVRPMLLGQAATSARVGGNESDPDTQNNSTTASAAIVAPIVAVVPPRVLQVRRTGIHHEQTQIAITFSGPLDPSRATDPRNYLIQAPSANQRLGTRFTQRIGLSSVTYDPSSNTVLLTPAQRLNFHHRFLLTLNGSTPSGLSDPAGALLDGGSTGHPGSNFVLVLHGLGVLFTAGS